MTWLKSLSPRARLLLGFPLLALLLACWHPARVFAQAQPYVMLKDRLDRPVDGYCIDIAGSGNWIDLRVPLSAHNCKGPGVAPDQALRHDPTSGQLRFPAYDMCVTALGRAGRSLPQMPLLVQPCASGEQPQPTPFAAPSLQAFDYRADARLELRGSGLCLVAGDKSDTTFSLHDRWRALTLQACEQAKPALSQWLPPPR